MFEVPLIDLPDPVGPPDDDWRPWDQPDFDVLIDRLAAADPHRPRLPVELLTDAEAGRLVDLREVDVTVLSDDALVTLVLAAERQLAQVNAVKLRAVATFAGPPPRDDVDPQANEFVFAWTEIGAALGVGEGTARRTVGIATELCRRLPGTFAALLAGTISYAKALRIVEATSVLSDEHARAVEDRVLPGAPGRTHAAHGDAVRRAVVAVDPEGWKARRKQRLRDVALIRESHGDGVADVLAHNVDAADAEIIWTAADTWARQAKAAGDPRTLDALRVAYLVEQAAAYLTGTPFTPATAAGTTDGAAAPGDATPATTPLRIGPPTRHGMPAVVNVLIGLPSLVGASIDPGFLAGTGEPLPAEAVADLLHAGARIRFALVDTHGTLQGITTTLHDPPALMRAFVALRDVVLRTPTGSSSPVAGQDLDHADPRGPTAPGNLHALTRGWHRAKTFGHWTVQVNPDSTITWTSRRTGRAYTTHPYNHRDGP